LLAASNIFSALSNEYLTILAGRIEHSFGAVRPLLVASQAADRQNKLGPANLTNCF
jgi:hypothetical protein